MAPSVQHNARLSFLLSIVSAQDSAQSEILCAQLESETIGS